MRKITKRSAAIALPVAVLGVVGVAYANTLGVSSNILGGGNDGVDNNCSIATSYVTGVGSAAGDSPANDVHWHAPVAAQTGPPVVTAQPAGYYLEKVTVLATGSDCTGATFRLTATDAGQNQISEFNGVITAADTAQRVELDRPVLADAVTDLYAVVTNAAS